VRTIVLVASTCVAVGVCVATWSLRARPTETKAATTSSAPHVDAPPAPSDPSAVIDALERRLAALENRPPVPPGAHPVPAPAASAMASARPHAPPPKISEVDALIEKEPRDARWATAYERDVTAAFAATFKDARVRESRCATSACRIVVAHGSPTGAMQFASQFWAALPEGYGAAHFEDQTGSDGSRTTILHVLRKGYFDTPDTE
jgi:hypothetical protein